MQKLEFLRKRVIENGRIEFLTRIRGPVNLSKVLYGTVLVRLIDVILLRSISKFKQIKIQKMQNTLHFIYRFIWSKFPLLVRTWFLLFLIVFQYFERL